MKKINEKITSSIITTERQETFEQQSHIEYDNNRVTRTKESLQAN